MWTAEKLKQSHVQFSTCRCFVATASLSLVWPLASRWLMFSWSLSQFSDFMTSVLLLLLVHYVDHHLHVPVWSEHRKVGVQGDILKYLLSNQPPKTFSIFNILYFNKTERTFVIFAGEKWLSVIKLMIEIVTDWFSVDLRWSLRCLDVALCTTRGLQHRSLIRTCSVDIHQTLPWMSRMLSLAALTLPAHHSSLNPKWTSLLSSGSLSDSSQEARSITRLGRWEVNNTAS